MVVRARQARSVTTHPPGAALALMISFCTLAPTRHHPLGVMRRLVPPLRRILAPALPEQIDGSTSSVGASLDQ
jgi:hypothetical protein